MMQLRPLLLAIAAVATYVGAASAQPPSTEPPPDVQAALARPVSPAAVALLLPYTSQPLVVQRLSQALRDPSPDVRAVAARIAFITRHEGLAVPLRAALDVEAGAGPGAEMSVSTRRTARCHGRSSPAVCNVQRPDGRSPACCCTVATSARRCQPRLVLPSTRSARLRRPPPIRSWP